MIAETRIAVGQDRTSGDARPSEEKTDDRHYSHGLPLHLLAPKYWIVALSDSEVIAFSIAHFFVLLRDIAPHCRFNLQAMCEAHS